MTRFAGSEQGRYPVIRCTRCQTDKPEGEFYFNRSRGRYNSWCKACVAEQRRSARGNRRPADAQTVGLEIEFVDATMTEVARAIQEATGQEHVPVMGYHSSTCRCCGRRFGTSSWRVMQDGSVTTGNRGGEVVSPILVFPRDAAVLRSVLDAMKSVGARVNTTCGLHVHHGVRGVLNSVEEFRTLVRNFVGSQDLMDAMLAPSRRSNYYAAHLDPQSAERLIGYWTDLGDITGLGDRYKALNLQPFLRIGTVEFRQHQGTLNFSKIMAWVEFGQAMVRAARARVATTEAQDVPSLFARLALASSFATDTREFLMARLEVLSGQRDDEDVPALARAA